MATAKRDYAAIANAFSTSAYGGVIAAASNSELFSVNFDLETNGYEGTHIFINMTCGSSTDNCIISAYGSLDQSTYDSVAFWAQQFDNTDTASARASIIIRDMLNFRLGFKSVGATDTWDFDIDYQSWRWDVT